MSQFTAFKQTTHHIRVFMRGNHTPAEYCQMLCDQFDTLYREGEQSGRVMGIPLHPFVIGLPFRIKYLDKRWSICFLTREYGEPRAGKSRTGTIAIIIRIRGSSLWSYHSRSGYTDSADKGDTMPKLHKKDIRFLGLLLALCFVSLVEVGFASAQENLDWQKKWQSLLASAKKEGRVVVYGPPGDQIRSGIVQGFTKAFPDLTVEYVGGSGTQLGTKIRSERDAQIYSLDVYVGGVSTISRILLPLNALDPLTNSLVLPEVTDVKYWREGRHHFGDKKGHFNLIFVSMVSPKLIYNPEQVKRDDVDELQELVDPKWKGKIVTFDPTGPGPGANYYRHIWLSLGPKNATEHFTRIRAHAVIERDQRRAIESVALGKYAFFLAPSSGVLEQLHARGLKFEVLEEFKDIGGHITASFGSLGLMNRAPHPNAAVVFINWLLSKEGQLVWSKAVNAVSRRVDVATDHLPKYSIPNPKTKYWDSDSEAASVTIPEEEKVLTEIFGR